MILTVASPLPLERDEMTDERKQATTGLRIKPGFFSDKEATALADALVAVLFPKGAPKPNPPGTP